MTISKRRKLVIFGVEDYAEIVYEYFTHDSDYEVVAFTVDRDYIKDSSLFGLPVIPFEDITEFYPPSEHEMHVAMVYNNMNRDRVAKCLEAKEKGYRLASYISSRSFVWSNAKIGEHAFIFEDNTIQPFTEIGDNCILWSGNHVGHESKIGDNVFISSHVVISGHCFVGDNCFVGVNSTLANGTTIGKETWVSHGSLISGDIPSNSLVRPIFPHTEVTFLNEKSLARSLARARK